MSDFNKKTDDIKNYMSELHISVKKGKYPTDREIQTLANKFNERDKDHTKNPDLEMIHVIRGFVWGMTAMRQISEGTNL